jgi:hypothetical protein
MILFLKSSAEEQAFANRSDEGPHHGWKPSNLFDDMKASVVWIDGDQMYYFVQLLNPGPSVLFESPISEEKLRKRVAEVDGIQEKITATLAVEDGAARAMGLRPYVNSEIWPVRLSRLRSWASAALLQLRPFVGCWTIPPSATRSQSWSKRWSRRAVKWSERS